MSLRSRTALRLGKGGGHGGLADTAELFIREGGDDPAGDLHLAGDETEASELFGREIFLSFFLPGSIRIAAPSGSSVAASVLENNSICPGSIPSAALSILLSTTRP